MKKPICVLVQGADDLQQVPGLSRLGDDVALRFARSPESLAEQLPGAQVLLGWDFREASLRDAWSAADALRWIHWSGAGVDAVLFPELVDSEVTLTNARGVFDRAMAEYVLGLVLAFAKRLPESLALQAKRVWQHRLTERVEGARVLVVGVGSIGREIASVLGAFGMHVEGLGQTARAGDDVFARIHAREDLDTALADADYVVVVAPLTDRTRGMFDAARFRAMKPSARFINVGRGAVVDESALVAALESGALAGAALDVFEQEPLSPQSPLWHMPEVIVSPHMSGDFHGYAPVLVDIFLDNFQRFRDGEPLRNVVDKRLGFVPSAA